MTEKMFKLSLVICKNVMFLVSFKDISVHPTYNKPVNVLNMKAEDNFTWIHLSTKYNF